MLINYSIYQIQHVDELDIRYNDIRYRMFANLGEDIQVVDFEKDNYKKIYNGNIESNRPTMEILDDLYEIFNTDHPRDFKGRSLSMSDIVYINNEYYHCQSCGWRKIDRLIV